MNLKLNKALDRVIERLEDTIERAANWGAMMKDLKKGMKDEDIAKKYNIPVATVKKMRKRMQMFKK